MSPIASRARTGLIAVTLALIGTQNVPSPARAQQGAPSNEVVAILNTASEAASFVQLSQTRGYRLMFQHDLTGLELQMVTLGLPEGVGPDTAISELENAAPYSVVGRNHNYRLAEAPKPRLFARDTIGWPERSCKAAANIGVIDTPVAPTRLGLDGDDVVTASFLREDETPSGLDHGESVAAILAGPAGLLNDATLFVAVAVMEDVYGEALARVDHLARSLNWMAENGVKVVNLSLAGPRNKIFAKVVFAAARKGMIMVAAVGNAGPDSPALYPAAFEEVIAVTAVDAAREVFAQAVRGPHVDVSAPGVDIWLSGVDRERYASGTSLATPYVAARLAVAAASQDMADVRDARALLAREAEDLGPAGRDPVFGAGLLRAPAHCL
ncbi:MAG: S8 family serine peptidase [Rhodobacteraceae bacterium]|nr:S8 family serine peptidase [Paracoccaceae bacterium]